MTTRRRHLETFRSESGQTLTEYGLMVALIAILVAAALPGVASSLVRIFSSATAAFGG